MSITSLKSGARLATSLAARRVSAMSSSITGTIPGRWTLITAGSPVASVTW